MPFGHWESRSHDNTLHVALQYLTTTDGSSARTGAGHEPVAASRPLDTEFIVRCDDEGNDCV